MVARFNYTGKEDDARDVLKQFLITKLQTSADILRILGLILHDVTFLLFNDGCC